MIPAPFTYRRSGSVAEALDLVGEYGDEAKFLAGGHSLLPLMKLRLAMPEGSAGCAQWVLFHPSATSTQVTLYGELHRRTDASSTNDYA